MDTPDNYYAVLGVPIDADSETLKHAYRQLARRFHPDLAGDEGAIQMKRINRAYDVLSDPQKRLNYDTIIGGVIDFRKGGLTRPRPRPLKYDPADDIEFSGLSIFSTRGPFHPGPVLRTSLGVISTVGSLSTSGGTIESLRELRFAATGGLLVGWGRLGVHAWDTGDGTLLWSQSLIQRAVSAHYSLDVVPLETSAGQREAILALPLLPDDNLGPRAVGVRGTDVVSHIMGTAPTSLSKPIRCVEEGLEKRQFWAIRLRALAQDAHTLLTLSCAHVPGEADEMAIVRRWNLTGRSRFGGKNQPQIALSVIIGRCTDYSPPYVATPDVSTLGLVYTGQKIRLYDTIRGTYHELASGTMGGSAKVAISPGAQWLAVAREDSEINEGVIDLWSISKGQIEQKLYHPWQISALHFTEKELVVALTDGTIQVWN